MTSPCFADLSVRPKGGTESLIKAASKLGIKVLGLEDTTTGSLNGSAEATIIKRVTIEADKGTDIEGALRKADRESIVVVVPFDYVAYRRAAKSSRVDMIRFMPDSEVKPDRETLNLMVQRGGGAVEIPLRPLLHSVSELRFLYDTLRRCYRVGLRAVIVSDAESAAELWHPLEVIGLLTTLGVPKDYAISTLTSSPGFVVSRRGLWNQRVTCKRA
ncbi:RNase P subunit p30 family protein [Acidilobus sp. 7A]|uniref:RNase P subunit p30 family protein n=1 Tax=Acidilobus sp. 7A TaxID=1577685 RepID=UPI000764E4EA|nr:RNase P subunit p30 family protein [Acidilobus sp. 7A]AMD31013.1 hypothetical protein SE86_06810 [Acidilobus sp. 7A]